MSTRVDILKAKADFDEHNQEHGCQPAYLRPDGEPPCPVRQALWAGYQGTAGQWGAEPGDAAKVTAQYAWQTALLDQRVLA